MKAQFIQPYYAGGREVAHGLKIQNESAIKTASAEMVKLIPNNSVIIPMPSSDGTPLKMLSLCEAMKKLNRTLRVEAVLFGNERESLYKCKKNGLSIPNMVMFQRYHLNNINENIFIIDNCIGTGRTGRTALKVFPNAQILVYASAIN